MDEMILKIIESAELKGIRSFGIKVVDCDIPPGTKIWDSKEIIRKYDDIQRDIKGTSCLNIFYDGFEVFNIDKDVKEALAEYKYFGDRVVLVGGSDSYEGNDQNETVIINPICLHQF